MRSAKVAAIKLRYVRNKRGNLFWEPTPTMRALGFLPKPLGPDAPPAWAEAQSLYEKWLRARDGSETFTVEETYPPGSLGEYYRLFKAKSKAWRKKALRTKEDYERAWKHIGPHLGRKTITKISVTDIEDFEEVLDTTLSPSERYRVMKCLRALFADAIVRLRLNIKDDLDKWRSLVHDDAIQSQASFRNQAWTTTKERENAVCEMIGLYSLFCEPALLSDPTYLSFLERIENAKDLFADMFRAQPLLAGLTVHVHRKPAFALDKTMGFLSVPVTAEAHKVLWFMKMRGEEAMFITKSFNERSKNFDSVSRLLKRRLRLRRLDRTEDVSVEEMTRACQRLLSLPTELRYLMFGLNLRIARSYDIAEDGAMCIPHDFEL